MMTFYEGFKFKERKLAQERAAERGRMREMEKQTKQTGGSGSGPMVANQTNFYACMATLKFTNAVQLTMTQF